MKSLYLLLLLIVLSIPLSSAQQAPVLNEPAVACNLLQVLQQLDRALAKGQTDRLTVIWAAAEGEWQKLFADAATPGFNKTYNQLQVSYLVFRQNQDSRMFRQDIATVLEVLSYQKYNHRG